MATTIQSRPEKTIEGTYKSRFIAIGHPTNKAVYTFIRKDTPVLSIIEGNDGNIIARGTDEDLVVPVGASVFIRYGGDYENVTGKVVGTNTTFLGGDIITDIPFTKTLINVQENYVNINSNTYYLTVNLYNAATGLLIASSVHESAPNGLIYYDAGPFLRSDMEVKCELEGIALNEADKKLSTPFYITYQETYLGEAKDLKDDKDEKFTGTFASNRVTDSHGQYMVPAFDANLLEANKGKFTTRFEKPCYFPGYPFALGFHYQPGDSETIPYKEEIYYTGARESVGGDSRKLEEDENYTYLQKLIIKKGYASNIKEVDVLLSQDGLEIGCLALDPTDFNVNWIFDENDVLQFIDLTIAADEQVATIDVYPDAQLFNNLGVLVETITHGGAGRYTPSLTHTVDTGIWKVVFTDIQVTLQSGDECDISLENEWNSAWCGIDYDSIGYDLVVYPNT